MTANTDSTSKIILALSVATFIFWYLGQLVNIYHYAVVGAIFEILWLPMLAMVVVLPVIALGFLIKGRFKRKSLHVYSLIIGLATIFVLVTSK